MAVEALHWKTPHEVVAPPTHVPLPLHMDTAVWIELPAGQVWGAHMVVAGHLLQVPAPLQAPVVPQVLAACAAQSPGCELPPTTAPHVPSGLPVYVFAQA
jgi:hypothetical protein